MPAQCVYRGLFDPFPANSSPERSSGTKSNMCAKLKPGRLENEPEQYKCDVRGFAFVSQQSIDKVRVKEFRSQVKPE